MRVNVNGRTLLPSCEGQSVARALAYVEAVLVDWRPGDRIGVRAQGLGTLLNFRPHDAPAAYAWLNERAYEALSACERGAPAALQSDTGTRPLAKGHEPAVAASPKWSRS